MEKCINMFNKLTFIDKLNKELYIYIFKLINKRLHLVIADASSMCLIFYLQTILGSF